MNSSIFNLMTGGNIGINGIPGLAQRLQQVKSMFGGGDPNDHIQKMLNDGRITQEQYNWAVQQAEQLKRMLGGR